MRYAYLEWSLILVGIWALVYALRRPVRRKLWVVSLSTTLLGLTEPLFVPAYWTPPTAFNLATRTGFDLESLLFAFAAGGLASTLYDVLVGAPAELIPTRERHVARHRWHRWALLSPPLVFIALDGLTRLNPIYSAILALLAGGTAALICRPDLGRRMALGAGVFLTLYFVYFESLAVAYPGYVRAVWNLPALSGVLIIGVPLEELLFAAALGWLWSGAYEHLTWTRERGRAARDVAHHRRRGCRDGG